MEEGAAGAAAAVPLATVGRDLELEGERVHAAPELVDPALELPRLAPEIVETRAETRQGPLDLGQGLGGAAVGGLDLGQEGGTGPLDLLLHPQEVRPQPIRVLLE